MGDDIVTAPLDLFDGGATKIWSFYGIFLRCDLTGDYGLIGCDGTLFSATNLDDMVMSYVLASGFLLSIWIFCSVLIG